MPLHSLFVISIISPASLRRQQALPHLSSHSGPYLGKARPAEANWRHAWSSLVFSRALVSFKKKPQTNSLQSAADKEWTARRKRKAEWPLLSLGSTGWIRGDRTAARKTLLSWNNSCVASAWPSCHISPIQHENPKWMVNNFDSPFIIIFHSCWSSEIAHKHIWLLLINPCLFFKRLWSWFSDWWVTRRSSEVALKQVPGVFLWNTRDVSILIH